MGLNLQVVDYITDMIKRGVFGTNSILRMCELGNQTLRNDVIEDSTPKTGKDYFIKKGFDHISLDIDGLDGALPIDLTKPIMKDSRYKVLINSFDILTNSGTSEHVLNQFECF